MKCWAVFEGERTGKETIRGVFIRRRKAEEYLSCFVARSLLPCKLCQADFSLAVSWLRMRVFARDNYFCVKCGISVTWHTGEMHEKKARGSGGQRTLENCETLCWGCHTGPRGEHGFAKARTSERI